MTDLSTAAQHLAIARQQGDVDDVAEALVSHANALVQHGQTAAARYELDEAAEIHRWRGRVYDEARCIQFSATLSRLQGDLGGAKQRAEQVLQLIEPGTSISVSAHAELGEIALAEQDGNTAAAAYADALRDGIGAGLLPAAQAELLRKRAIALTYAGQPGAAADDLATAYELLAQTADSSTAVRTLVERATALHLGGTPNEAEQAWQTAMHAAQHTNDHHALADLYLLRTTRAIEQYDVKAALVAAQQARTEALAAIAPLSYLSAVVAIADLSDATDDRAMAYETLATAWVTMSDLLGREAVKAMLQPKLMALRDRWGVITFAAVKQEYDARRRVEKANLAGPRNSR